MITTQLPYPPISGGAIKSWKLIEYLSNNYDVYLACFLKNDDSNNVDEFLTKVSLKGKYLEELNVPRTAINLIKSNILGIPLNLYRNRSKSFLGNIRNICKDFDIIFIDHYEMYQYVPKEFAGKVVLHQHNCEYLIWQRFAEVERSFFRRLALKNQAFLIKRYESKICNESDSILASPNDEEELVKIGAPKDRFYETYHLGDQELLDLPELVFDKTEKSILFIGTLTWEANIDGLVWFLNETWNALKVEHPGIKFYIVGKNPDKRILDLVKDDEQVILTGFVNDLEDYFSICRVFVSPLRFGSGIKVKVMNALYRGIPMVTTSVGAEGLAIENRKHLLLANDSFSYTSAVSELLEDSVLWDRLRVESRTLASDKYTWDKVLKDVSRAIDD